MSRKQIKPRLVYADRDGNIFDHPELLMLCRKGNEFVQPGPKDLMPLPKGSDFFLLPGRNALGLEPGSGTIETFEAHPVATFVCPGHTLTGICAFESAAQSPPLPLFAYGALGYANGRFWVCANQVDPDPRQRFEEIPQGRIEQGARDWLTAFPENRLVRHLANCALNSCCPAARNLALGRYEAPLPTAQGCNAACLGCISLQPGDSGFPATQSRIRFRPSAKEVLQIMQTHARHESRPIFSFGQGCEGEPLLEASLIGEACRMYRQEQGIGTININTNGSLPATIPDLAGSGLSSIRVSLNSGQEEHYSSYYRPGSYGFAEVKETIRAAKSHGLFVSLNYLFFPGFNDTEQEYAAFSRLLEETGPDFIQLRNLNLDPELYLQTLNPAQSPFMGFHNFKKRLKKDFPWIRTGYFNPWLGDEGHRE
ncbi:MAG: radical SAM protein [Desulfohalobiaceae bacterium]|nr:radical SAM protein [Desulfohalobiaceae bacterium]